jgi:hypothetical protein
MQPNNHLPLYFDSFNAFITAQYDEVTSRFHKFCLPQPPFYKSY